MKADAKIPVAFDVLRNAERARATQVEAPTGAAPIDAARMNKAAEGLLKRGAREIARYFELNVANPFPKGPWTADIFLAEIPEAFAFTALGKELKASLRDDDRLAMLTAPLEKLLAERGYSAEFSRGAGQESGTALSVRLRIYLHEG